MSKNVVISVGMGYKLDHIDVFISSFRAHNLYDDIVLVMGIDDFTPDIVEYCKANHVKMVMNDTMVFMHTQVNNSRFIYCLEHLLNNTHQYDKVLLADIRDVVFQEDPFKGLAGEFLYFFEEDSGVTIEEEQFNRRWIEITYGLDVLHDMAKFNIICVGTVMGSYNQMVDWLRKFRDVAFTLKCNIPNVYYGEYFDQTVANHMARYPDQYDISPVIHKNGYLVSTVGLTLTHPSALDIIEVEEELVRINDFYPAIIHQYDRSPVLKKLFEKLNRI